MDHRATHADVTEAEFKEGMRHIAASVNIITVDYNGQKDGLTATAACSVSAEPPQLLICVNQSAGAHKLIINAGKFALNVLARDQEDIAMRFAGIDGADRKDRYKLGHWKKIITGAPILTGALANFDCEVKQVVSADSHSIIIGRIVGIESQDGPPLIYGAGQFTGLTNL